ncbi:hypothetical protein AAFF_G00263880 [Aldrovandia affinis]|uniref:Integrase catalytic domain-containing protein n=1 Tax=Aldrovandia affinis TaxID=143900 RepID=A0AAD7ST71_9TELE|nr:hypothetical protein AAFF_G00263880 [Aldrovandia affinis]
MSLWLMGEEDQWLKPRTVLGTLHLADVHSSSQTVQAEEQTQEEGRRVVFIRSMVAESPPPSTISGLDELKWPDLSPHEITTAKTLLSKYSDTFSLYEGDVGCTNLIHHEIPLVDDVPLSLASPSHHKWRTTTYSAPAETRVHSPHYGCGRAPVRTQADLQALQAADPAIKAFLPYWRRGGPQMEQKGSENRLRCWGCLENGRGSGRSMGYSTGDPDTPSREAVHQLLLPKVLQAEVIAIDFATLERASDGRENILVVTDVFSKFSQAYPTSDQKAHTVVKILTEKWFYTYGVPNGFTLTKAATLKESYSSASASCMAL